jgi:hypothetical protein
MSKATNTTTTAITKPRPFQTGGGGGGGGGSGVGGRSVGGGMGNSGGRFLFGSRKRVLGSTPLPSTNGAVKPPTKLKTAFSNQGMPHAGNFAGSGAKPPKRQKGCGTALTNHPSSKAVATTSLKQLKPKLKAPGQSLISGFFKPRTVNN